MPRKRAKEPFTLLIIPHSQRRPISIRFPSWTLTGLLFALAITLAVVAAFAARYHTLSQQVARLQAASRTVETEQQTLHRAILSQHNAVESLEEDFDARVAAIRGDYDQLYREVGAFQSGLTAQVEAFKVELQQIQRLSQEVRDVVGLEDAELSPSEASTEQPAGGMGTGQQQTSLIHEHTPRVELAVDDALDAEKNPTVRQLQSMYDSLPAWYGEMQHLHDQVDERMALIDPGKRTSPEEVERQLALWDAAPKGWPVGGRISSNFGYRRFRGERDFHTGIDVAVWYKTPVHATAGGTVVAAGWQSGFGWTVEIQHERGYSTVYGHLSRYLVDVGDKVKKGQTIGLSGSSGNSTGPHLHYEVQSNGVPIDPWRYATANDGK